MHIKDIVSKIEEIAPLELGEPWDNSGIQIKTKDEIKKILICLEINSEVVNEAITNDIDLIITHHPLLFDKPSSIDVDGVQGNYIISLIKNNISVYSSHIPFDNSPKGNNFYLGAKIALSDMVSSSQLGISHPGIVGRYNESKKLVDVINIIADELNMDKSELKVVGDLKKDIDKVAICTGSGFDLMYEVLGLNCDLVISSEVKLHQAQFAKEINLALIDAGHYYTEQLFVENLGDQLNKTIGKSVEVIKSTSNTNPFSDIM